MKNHIFKVRSLELGIWLILWSVIAITFGIIKNDYAIFHQLMMVAYLPGLFIFLFGEKIQ